MEDSGLKQLDFGCEAEGGNRSDTLQNLPDHHHTTCDHFGFYAHSPRQQRRSRGRATLPRSPPL